MLTRVGELTFQMPHVRSGNFDPSAQDGGTRTAPTSEGRIQGGLRVQIGSSNGFMGSSFEHGCKWECTGVTV